MARRQEAQLALRPLAVAAAGELARADRDLRLPHLVAGAQRVGVGRQEGEHALLLVRLHPQAPDQQPATRQTAERGRSRIRSRTPRDQQHSGRHRHEHRGAAQVGLEGDEHHRQRHEREGGRRSAAAAAAGSTAPREVARQVERRDQLGELRRLEADRAERGTSPALRPPRSPAPAPAPGRRRART